MSYNKYVITTSIYGLLGILGIIGAIYFAFQGRILLIGISALFAYVSFDNFFCGSRAKACGLEANSHYIIPEFLKRNK